jgi:hypothetical protein
MGRHADVLSDLMGNGGQGGGDRQGRDFRLHAVMIGAELVQLMIKINVTKISHQELAIDSIQ